MRAVLAKALRKDAALDLILLHSMIYNNVNGAPVNDLDAVGFAIPVQRSNNTSSRNLLLRSYIKDVDLALLTS